MPIMETDALLPTRSTPSVDGYSLSYWFKGFLLSLPKTQSAAQAMLCCCLLEIFQGCCALIESYVVQYVIGRDKAHLIVVSSLVFAAIDPVVVDSKAVLQTIINRETHRNIMSTLEKKNWDATDNDSKKGLSINKIGAIDTYYQEIRSLMLNLVTLFLSLGSLVADCWPQSRSLVIICIVYSLWDNTFDAMDIAQCHATIDSLLAAKSLLSGRPLDDVQLEESFNTYHKLNLKHQIAKLRRTWTRIALLSVALALSLYIAMSQPDEVQWEMIGVGFLNSYRQNGRLKRIFEAGSRSRAGMDRVLNKLET